jgi:hypothetical protein
MNQDIKILDNSKPLLFLGDHHGEWINLLWIIKNKKIKDCYLVSVGDCGIGFDKKFLESEKLENLNIEFKNRGIVFMGIRGNHDDPYYFRGENRVELSNFKLIEDYTLMKYEEKTIQFIGGATSIDRTSRKEGVSYWSDEIVNFERDKCKNVDILITHTAPSWCFPCGFNEMVYGWAREDAYLLEELSDERAVMDEILKLCAPKLHLYGHFHDSWTEEINGCRHKLLNINEIYELIM